MNSSAQKGKSLVIAIIVTIVSVSLMNSFFTNLINPNQPFAEIVKDGIRLALTFLVCYFLYQGHGWAKWVLGVLAALGGFVAIPGALLVIRFSLLGAFWLLVMGAIYLAASWVLLRSPEVKAFQSSQRAARSR